ncbi:MAG: 5-methyltetrahydropteroyltriglutamate--homocysteine S-methyltransferase [Acidimicrobiales bacterium]|nr:5-methyltetrahydropteroyltriglutamate--homocysteine S-methyltransferase [Acidimicrobiales bacterium]
MSVLSTNLGFPRMGPARELKTALESHWRGELDAAGLAAAAAERRADNWQRQTSAGLDHVPSNDFSLYDHVLDTAVMVGAIPDRYREAGTSDLATYFAMARGGHIGDREVTALEMTKWFDTNYHYLVPELRTAQTFELASTKPVDELHEARAHGTATRPVLLGPVSFLHLAKREGINGPMTSLDALLPVYEELVQLLHAEGATWLQIDEPILVHELPGETIEAIAKSFQRLRYAAPDLQVLVTTYFGGLRDNLDATLALPVDAVHLDLVTDAGQLDRAIEKAPSELTLSLGVVDGRNVWRTDLPALLDRLEPIRDRLGADRLMVGPSCSMLHLPVDLSTEIRLDGELSSWLAFATQRLDEISILTRALNEGRDALDAELAASGAAAKARRESPRTNDPGVRQRLDDHRPEDERRERPYRVRRATQTDRLGLPTLPTTTIGSFPQTKEVRSMRARFRKGKVDEATYTEAMRAYVRGAISFQEAAGLDVLVHGEPERNDMVEYFGGLLDGCAVTDFGWVQSFGSRCVKPPVIYGDVKRPAPMTVDWIRDAQSLTDRPVKGMLTGPVTILQWSFVRDDQPVEETCRQIAYAIRDEVTDLEAAGQSVIQIDEPAFREGLPLHAEDHKAYLDWAVAAFRIASSAVGDGTQIHTHMCYAEFNDIIESIAAFDADVISIEASRSRMELLGAFSDYEYPNEIGPGLFDIHSPRIPTVDEMVELLHAAAEVIPFDRLWANPDCGLKTRQWDEVRPALENMVAAAVRARAELGD